MISFRLEFSEDEMVRFFRNYGLQVIDVTFVEHIPAYHNRTEEQQITSKCIVNPHSQKTVPVSIAFEKCILTAAKSLLLGNITKLHVLESLK